MKIPPRSSLKPYLPQILELGAQGLDAAQIQKQLDLPVLKEQVRRILRKLGVPPTPAGARPGAGNHRWTGGRVVDPDGYILVHSPGHPYARNKGRGRSGYVAEHRLVMEQKLGRYLLPNEVVHHIDGDNVNNAPHNLELFQSNADHLRHELTGKCPKWTEDRKRRIREGVYRGIQTKRMRASSRKG